MTALQPYVDFLGAQAPYDALDAADLEALAQHTRVEVVAQDTILVKPDQDVLDHLWIIRSGGVDVVDRGRVLDELGPGDTFGYVSLLSGLRPALLVRSRAETVLYRLPDPRTFLRHPERLKFSHYGTLAAGDRTTRHAVVDSGGTPARRFLRPVVECGPETTVREAARRINAAHQSSVIVRSGDGIGILTDSDFRRAAGTGALSLGAPAADLATFPALTVHAESSRAQAFVTMVEHGVHHLVAVDDHDRPVGIVRAIDLASAEVRDPLLVRAAIDTATSREQLASAAALLPATAVELVDSGVPAARVGGLLAAVREGLLRKLVQLNAPADAHGSSCAWFVLGSTARREPLPSSDMDTAIAWASDPLRDEVGPSDDTAGVWRAVAAHVLDDMERCGVSRCPDGANATNPLFSRSVRDWALVATAWRRRPAADQALLLTSMAADCRPVTELSIGRAVLDETAVTAPSREFLAMMLRFTLLVKPPVGFVRGFVVEHTGEHRGRLNLKRGGLMPIASIGRWVAVVTGDPRGSTPERLRRGRSANVLTTDEADTLVGAFDLMYTLLLEREVESLREGIAPDRYIDPSALDSLTRRYLRAAFREVGHVQSTLESEWISRLP